MPVTSTISLCTTTFHSHYVRAIHNAILQLNRIGSQKKKDRILLARYPERPPQGPLSTKTPSPQVHYGHVSFHPRSYPPVTSSRLDVPVGQPPRNLTGHAEGYFSQIREPFFSRNQIGERSISPTISIFPKRASDKSFRSQGIRIGSGTKYPKSLTGDKKMSACMYGPLSLSSPSTIRNSTFGFRSKSKLLAVRCTVGGICFFFMVLGSFLPIFFSIFMILIRGSFLSFRARVFVLSAALFYNALMGRSILFSPRNSMVMFYKIGFRMHFLVCELSKVHKIWILFGKIDALSFWT